MSFQIQAAAERILEGELVAFPTETVYGLGANALDPVAVAKIFALKGRPQTSPLIVHVSSIEMARKVPERVAGSGGGTRPEVLAGPADDGAAEDRGDSRYRYCGDC